ncbi:hypothetical protein MHK_011021, partial [Candidatus Magnetomorum sp. HK-1]
MEALKRIIILLPTFLLLSCHTQNQQLHPGRMVGIKFCKPGVFEIHSNIDQWTMLQKGLWKGQLAQLNVSTTTRNVPKTIPGFFYLKDQDGNTRFQAEVCQNGNFPINKLDIYLVSKINPGQLSLNIKENIVKNDYFVTFKTSHFQCSNIHPKKISIGQQNQNVFIRLLFENLPQPIVSPKKISKNFLPKRPVKDTIVSGLFFDNKGEFDIKGEIQAHEWEQKKTGQWMARLQRLIVHVKKATCYYSGFRFYKKDHIIKKHRYQMEIDASKNGQIQGPPLKVYIKSKKRPGKLTFSTKQNIPAHETKFIPFTSELFHMDNTQASFLVHDYISDRFPSICVTFNNMNKPVKQKKSIPAKVPQKYKYSIFSPLAQSVSNDLSQKISETFLKSLDNKLKDIV